MTLNVANEFEEQEMAFPSPTKQGRRRMKQDVLYRVDIDIGCHLQKKKKNNNNNNKMICSCVN